MKTLLYTIVTILLISTGATSACGADRERPLTDTTSAYPALRELEAIYENGAFAIAGYYVRKTTDSIGVTTDSMSYGFSNWRSLFAVNLFNILTPGPNYDIYTIQTDLENAVIDRANQFITINKRISIMEALFQLNLLDPWFQEEHVQRMYMVDTLDGYARVIKLDFKPESPYSKFELCFSAVAKQPLELTVVTKKANENGTEGYDQIKITYTSWFEFDVDGDYSSAYTTEVFYTRINGQYVLKPFYANYDFLNTSIY
ncbi:hypothetical protein [Paraflavitalea sp. CAU 1676]|uniref:hypothetical protein n=1 Tax=Paraflavitalea sp. CAU 1676 TaxID=3032598 RepID=UPI0023DCDABB|nr:hypothetical protein [Paraflavitalea sp. CAU 1676]MDF2188424.1 hypothetical protein [Paraflavitalea sp. CAU 1676]